MDDIFNPNGTNPENPSVENENKETEQFVSQEPFNQKPVPQQMKEQPPAPQQPVQTPPPYSAAPMGAPQGFPPQQPGYMPRPQQPLPHQQPVFYNPNGTTQPVAPVAPPKKKKKKKGLAGKIIFIILICISIITSSVAIGISIGKNDNSNTPAIGDIIPDNNETTDSKDKFGSGATPSIEDSPQSLSEYSGEGAMTSEQVYNHVKDINVGVIVYAQNQNAGEGSGIIVGEDETKTYTYILTAAHVIAQKGIDVQIQFNDETECEAEIIGLDSKTDVGVLRVAKTGFKAASFGNSDKLTVGQKVYAIGNPGGTEFFGSFTSGMISAIDRPVPTNNSSYDLPCIQHNAAINPGNSGGALVNEYGQVIGLNSSKISSTEYEGMGFSVPVNTVLEVYDQIVKYGYVTNRPKLGITYIPVSQDYSYSAIAWQNDLPYGSIVIATIDETSGLANTNVKTGDIITAVNGKELETTDILLETIENSKVGDKLKLSICRVNNNGTINTTFDVTIKLVEDKGNSTSAVEPETTPFDGYFENFGY